MIDKNLLKNADNITFKKYRANHLIRYKTGAGKLIPIEFNTIDAMCITNFMVFGKKCYVQLKIHADTAAIITNIVNKYKQEYNIEDDNFVNPIREQDGKYAIKLKVNYYKFIRIDTLDCDGDHIGPDEFQKLTTVKAKIKLSSFWLYNGKVGMIAELLKIAKTK